jgi:NAD(P)-dependent dehydrogenase (short-subunit alcohol dehydrogenase family)
MSQLFQTPFGRHSTASEVIDGVDLSGKRAIVTGAGSGIGTETARALASAGADVVLAVRRPQAAGQIAAGIASSTGNTKVSVRALDLADQDSVRRLAAAWDQPLHILVNNAGIMALPELERTREGWEMQFATNFLGHFALTAGLHDALAEAHGARIVSVSSSGHLLSPLAAEALSAEALSAEVGR